MTFDSLKEACDKINVSFNDDLLYYHKELVGRYYKKSNGVVCDIISIGLCLPPYEGLDDVNEIVKYIVKAIKYFKERDNEIRLKRINDDF